MSAIFVDSFCDLDIANIKKLNINMVELNNDYASNFIDAFEPYLQEQEDILYFSTNLQLVKNEFNQIVKKFEFEYKNRKIKAIDLASYSVCAGLIAYEIGVMYKRGLTDIEIIDFVKSYKNEVYGVLISNNKNFIKNNCKNDKFNLNSTSNLIVPLILAKGLKMEVIEKAQGKKKGISYILNMADEYCVNMADYPMIVGYSNDAVNAEYLKKCIIEQFGEDTIVILQKFSNHSVNMFDSNALMLAFYSKKIK